MDIQMPVLDGFEALKEIREQRILTPIVALTAHAMKGDRERCIDAGFTDYLSKPVSRSELLAKVASFIRPTAPADDASPDTSPAPEAAPRQEAAPTAQEPAITRREPTPTSRESAITYEAIVAEFRALLVAHADALKEAREARDCGELRRICHKLKGTAGAMGFDKIANLVTSAYSMLEGPGPKCALPVVQELEQACREEAATGTGKAGSVAVPRRAAGPRNHENGDPCHSRT
jgi:CheY-like chemotaxis protein